MPYNTQLLRDLRFTIGQNIQRRRVSEKLPLRKLARLSGVRAEKIDQYELGKSEISLEELLRIACALGMEMENKQDG